MKKPLRIILCLLLVAALAAPVFAGPAPAKGSKASLPARLCEGGAYVGDQAAGLCTGCLKRTFSLFNPCLDFVKGCTSVVLMPIDKSCEYMEKAAARCWTGKKAAKTAVPK